MSDYYQTLQEPVIEILFKEKGSKFIGYAYPIENENQVKPLIEQLKKEHHQARHVCYAYQIGVKNISYRASDDGEPNNTAGIPILGQIKSFELTNVLIAVVRYFGGTKLGVGGLIKAYKTTAKETLEQAVIIQKEILQTLYIEFEYPNMNKIMRVIHENHLVILNQNQEINCKMTLGVKEILIPKMLDAFQLIATKVKIID